MISRGIVARVNESPVGATRFERATSTPGNTAVGGIARAKSDVIPADLARLIEAWGSLTADDRRRIRAIVDGRLALWPQARGEGGEAVPSLAGA